MTHEPSSSTSGHYQFSLSILRAIIQRKLRTTIFLKNCTTFYGILYLELGVRPAVSTCGVYVLLPEKWWVIVLYSHVTYFCLTAGLRDRTTLPEKKNPKLKDLAILRCSCCSTQSSRFITNYKGRRCSFESRGRCCCPRRMIVSTGTSHFLRRMFVGQLQTANCKIRTFSKLLINYCTFASNYYTDYDVRYPFGYCKQRLL